MSKEEKWLISGIISAFLGIYVLYLTVNSSLGNIISYIITIVSTIFFAGVVYLLISLIKIKAVENIWIRRVAFVCLIGITIVLLYIYIKTDYFNEDASYESDWFHIIPYKLVFVIAIFVGLTLFYISRNVKMSVNKLAWYIYVCVMSVVYAFTTVILNCFSGDSYHLNAYIHPIYNVYYNQPYSSVSYSIYGHYELFYKAIMKIFGTDPYVIMVTVWFLSFIVGVLTLRIIFKLCENGFIRIVIPIALCAPTGALFQSVSYMTTPHRLIFGVLLLTYAMKQKKFKCYYLVGYLICSLSLVWNTESGLVYILSWCVYVFFEGEKNTIRKFLKRIILCIFGSIVTVILSLLIVNIYNVIVGGGLFIRHFFYPILNDQFIEDYVLKLDFGDYPYVCCMILSIAVIIYCFSKLLINKRLKNKQSVFLMNGVIIIGLESYYITRPAFFALLIVYPYVLIALVFFATIGLNKIEKKDIFYLVKCYISFLMCIVISSLCVISFGLPQIFADSYEAGRYIRPDIEAELTWIEENVPEDAYAFGWGIDEWYGYLHRKITYKLVGTTDVLLDRVANKEAYEQLQKETCLYDNIFMQEYGFSNINVLSIDYVMDNRYELKNNVYALFKKKTYKTSEVCNISELEKITDEVKYCFESSVEDNGYLSLSGYCLDDTLDYSISNDNISIGLLNEETGEVIVCDTLSVKRQDLVESMSNDNYMYSGFYSRLNEEEYDQSANYVVIIIINGKYIKTVLSI